MTSIIESVYNKIVKPYFRSTVGVLMYAIPNGKTTQLLAIRGEKYIKVELPKLADTLCLVGDSLELVKADGTPRFQIPDTLLETAQASFTDLNPDSPFNTFLRNTKSFVYKNGGRAIELVFLGEYASATDGHTLLMYDVDIFPGMRILVEPEILVYAASIDLMSMDIYGNFLVFSGYAAVGTTSYQVELGDMYTTEEEFGGDYPDVRRVVASAISGSASMQLTEAQLYPISTKETLRQYTKTTSMKDALVRIRLHNDVQFRYYNQDQDQTPLSDFLVIDGVDCEHSVDVINYALLLTYLNRMAIPTGKTLIQFRMNHNPVFFDYGDQLLGLLMGRRDNFED